MGLRDVGPGTTANLTIVSISGRRRASYRLENTVDTVRVAEDPAEPSTGHNCEMTGQEVRTC